jgi:hypothetical protein
MRDKDGISLTNVSHPEGLIEKVAEAIRDGRLTLTPKTEANPQALAALRHMRSICPEGIDARIQIHVVRLGYAHCLYEGTCDPTVTLDDLARLFAHPQWGARSAWIRDGLFSIIRHLD